MRKVLGGLSLMAYAVYTCWMIQLATPIPDVPAVIHMALTMGLAIGGLYRVVEGAAQILSWVGKQDLPW